MTLACTSPHALSAPALAGLDGEEAAGLGGAELVLAVGEAGGTRRVEVGLALVAGHAFQAALRPAHRTLRAPSVIAFNNAGRR